MRPLGDTSQALRAAAVQPGTVRDLCARAQVGMGVGRYTASRMVQRGELVVLSVPSDVDEQPARVGRPAALLVAADVAPCLVG
jgi:hypothetical protein